jgi:DNA repair exonuclease SbcCD ATPase subunit
MSLEQIKEQIVGEVTRVAADMKEVVKEQERQFQQVRDGVQSTVDEAVVNKMEDYNSKLEDLNTSLTEVKAEINKINAEDSRVLGGTPQKKNIGSEFVGSDSPQGPDLYRWPRLRPDGSSDRAPGTRGHQSSGEGQRHSSVDTCDPDQL